MNHFPDFSAYGFQILRELGRNPSGGRVTYLAQTPQNHPVVLKQFQFAKGGNWDGFKAIDRETQTLKDLNHPGIPRYLGTLETEDGFCLVQEYKEARSLSEPRSFSPDEVKHIATALLEILVYLQEERIPPVFHRDIKPENILVGDDLRVYLIDFGFARIGGDNLTMSSVAMGTFGFMAPEQSLNRQLTPASDLYGLGLTLVCVIAQLKSHEIGEYVDYSNQLDQKAIEAKVKGCSFRFIEWLNQMVAPDPQKRFPDAATALAALKPLYVKRTPSVEFDRSLLEFQATKLGEKLSQTITIVNKTSETTLEGYWEVAPHPNDPPHTPDDHEWISILPRQIQGNQVKCTVSVDTSKLRAESKGKRQLVLHSNATEETVPLAIEVQTAPRPVKLPVKRYVLETLYSVCVIANTIGLGLILSFGYQVGSIVGGSRALNWAWNWFGLGAVIRALVGAVAGAYIGGCSGDGGITGIARSGGRFLLGFALGCIMLIPILMAIPDGDHDMVSVIAGYASMGATGALTGTLACIAVAAPWTGSVGITRAVAGSFIGTLGSIIVGGSLVSLGLTDLGSISAKNLVALGTVLAVTFAVVLTVTNPILKYYKDLLESDRQEAWFSFWLRYFLAIPFGISVGLGLAGNFSAHFLIPATAIASGAALLYVSFNPILQHHRQLATYRRQEQHLIEP